MKKTTLIALALLAVVLLVAATPAPMQKLSGTLQFERNSDLIYPDFIALPVMVNVYLKGDVFPTHGQYANCHVDALGYYVPSTGISRSKLFEVRIANIVCPFAQTSPDVR